MDKQTYAMLHASADRLALEASRQSPVGQEADGYIEAYEKALEFLASEYKKYSPTKNKPSTTWSLW